MKLLLILSVAGLSLFHQQILASNANLSIAAIQQLAERAILDSKRNPSGLNYLKTAELFLLWHAEYDDLIISHVGSKLIKPKIDKLEIIEFAEKSALLKTEEAVGFLITFYRDKSNALRSAELTACWERVEQLFATSWSERLKIAKSCIKIRQKIM